MPFEEFQANLSKRWIIERGLISAASVIFDITDHILAGHFGCYAQTYEESLQMFYDKKVLSHELYCQIKGLGGFRNILIHRYLQIDQREVYGNFYKALDVFPYFIMDVLSWLDNEIQ